MNDLQHYFENNKGRLIHKWQHYFEVYDRHFSRFRDKEINILEIGLYQGGSIQMWKHYFGSKATIYGLDINPACKALEEENVKIFIGSQSDRPFLQQLIKELPPIDILIDDGGHTMQQQIISFEELFKIVKEDGVYLCEDCHTSYWRDYGGGYKRRGSYIEYAKNFVDYINAWHSNTKELQVNDFTRTAKSVHFYDSIVVVEKGKVERPSDTTTGIANIPEQEFPAMPLLQRKVIGTLDKILYKLKLPSILK